jgi:hypothetical protein
MRKLIALSALCIGTVSFLSAKISTPSIFGSNMVLQRDHACPVWGWADPNASVTLTFAGKVYTTKADESGEWKIKLTPLSASSKPRDMVLTEGKANGFNSARKNFSRWLKNRPGSLVYENILIQTCDLLLYRMLEAKSRKKTLRAPGKRLLYPQFHPFLP